MSTAKLRHPNDFLKNAILLLTLMMLCSILTKSKQLQGYVIQGIAILVVDRKQ